MRLAFAILLCALQSFGAQLLINSYQFAATEAGGEGGGYLDISAAWVETNGFVLALYVQGMSTNGGIANGFGANNTPTTPNIQLTVTSPGYTTNGDATTHDRMILGTQVMRLPYPNEAINSIVADGTNCIVRLALDEYVFSNDTALTLTVSNGGYFTTNGGTVECNTTTGISVTNLSTESYAATMVIANRTWPGFQRETNSTMRLRAVGFHALSKTNFQPLACMRFIVRDEHGHAASNTIPAMRVDSSLPDALAFGEYYADVDISGMTPLDKLRCDKQAIPEFGDASAILDTTTLDLGPPYPGPITNLCDTGNAYSDAIAVVGAGNIDDNGVVTNTTYDAMPSSGYFSNITAAMAAIQRYNATNFGHADPGGGIVYVRSSITNYPGTISSNIAIPAAWPIIQSYPGEQFVLRSRGGGDPRGMMVKFVGIKFAPDIGQVPLFRGWRVWFDQCILDTANTGPIQEMTNIFLTDCWVTNFAQGLRASGSGSSSFGIIRGCDLTGFNHLAIYRTMVGNKTTAKAGGAYTLTEYASGANPPPRFPILYNNELLGFVAATPCVEFGGSYDVADGVAIVQNVIERCGATDGTCGSFNSSGSHEGTNVIIWHNVATGQRIADIASSGTETETVWRKHWSIRNNIFDVSGFKNDATPTADADRVGNWSILYQVGCSGNAYVECPVSTVAAGAFPPIFEAGISSHYPANTNTFEWVQFTSRQSYAGDGESAGGGDYSLGASSPVRPLAIHTMLPLDMNGASRATTNMPGAYVE